MRLTKLLIISSLFGGATLAQGDERTFGNGSLPEFLEAFDADGNGTISEEERQAIKEARHAARDERRKVVDTDGDGEISPEEREAALQAVRDRIAAKRAEKFARVAGDDGLLSLEEFSNLPPLKNASEERIASIFARLDTSEDGNVDAEEFEARLRKYGRGKGRGKGPGHDDDEEPDGEEPDGEEPGGEEPDGEEPDGEEPDGEEPGGEEPGGEEPDGEEGGGN